ncbi:MIP/aquaporin family protein [Neobacillus cucumis]|uniref:MIP/aquaporin family protein n=1 Tax=Neobacillus cucumis TaxID=1740721 RepID=UPI002E1A8706|nr:aquaporin family protein [Neobacillus cucumis]
MTAFWGEVVGTAILLFIGGSVCAGASLKKSFAYNAGWFTIQFAWGMAVTIAIFTVGNISGAHLNPVITLALAFTGNFPWEQVPGYIAAQFLGAMIGAAGVYLQYFPHWKETKDPNVILGVFSTGPAIQHTFSNLLSEIIATFILVLGILSIGANKFTDGLHPIAVGFLIMTLSLALAGTTGAALNPARDLGPRIMHFLLPIPSKGKSNWRYAWIPVIGPILGGVLGGFFYNSVFLGKMSFQLFITLGLTALILVLSYFSGMKKQKLLKSDAPVVTFLKAK